MTEAEKCLEALGGKCPHCRKEASILIQRVTTGTDYLILKCRDCFDDAPEFYYPEAIWELLDATVNPFAVEIDI